MSKLSEKLEKELDNDDQLASLRLEYKFEGVDASMPVSAVYGAKERSTGDEVEIRFFELDQRPGRRGSDGATVLKRRETSDSEEEQADPDATGEGLGQVSNSLQDGETDSIPDSLAEFTGKDEEEEAAPELEFERKSVDGSDLLTRLSHPHLVEVEGHWRGRNLVAVASEPCSCRPITEDFRDDSFRDEPDAITEIARDLADALHHVHERGTLHLNVTPANIAREEDGDVRLLNAGVAELIEEALEEDEVRGTPGYTAPERFDADEAPVGPWSDLYSLGAFMYRATTGSDPFSGSSDGEIIGHQFDGDFVAPRSVNPNISPFLERVMVRLLQREPADRYRSADELVWDLDKYLELPESERFEVRREPRVWDTGLSSTGGVFFGRQTEMDELTAHLLVDADRPVVALVQGSRGVGKTALLENQIERLERQELGPVFATAAGDLDSVAAVVMLARGAVRKILESNRFDADRWRSHFHDAPPSIRTLVPRIPRLRRLLPETEMQPTTSDDNRRALMRNVVAWRDLFEVLIDGPNEFTWIVDDLHRLGELSGEILAEFIHRRDDLPSRWLLSQTPGENPNGDEWIEQNIEESESQVKILGLQALDRGQVRSYFDRLLHASDDLLERFVDRLMGVSGGRPELIQIALQQLADSGAVAFRAGKLRIDGRHLEDVELAEDLAAYALQAWEELDGEHREIAYNVALLGDCIPKELLVEIGSVPRDEFEQQVATLASKRILEVTDATYSRLISCSENTVREFVRKQLNQSEFERRHRMLAFEFSDFFELVEEDRFDAGWLCVNIAQQWVAAGEPDRAVDWLAQAGQIRLTEGRVLNALRLLQEGMLRAEDPFDVYANGVSMVELLGDAHAAAGEGGDAVERYKEALDRSGDFEEQQRLRLKLGRGLQHRQSYRDSYNIVGAYLQERGIEVPASEERLAFSVVLLFFKYFAFRLLYRLGIYEPERASDREVTRELEHFEATRILAYNLRQHDNWFPFIWIHLSTEIRAHELKDSRLLAVNYMGHALACCQLPYALPGRAETFRDLALEEAEKCDDDRVRSFVGASAASVSLKLGQHEELVRFARQYRPVAVSEGAFADYQDILESLIYLSLYAGDLAAADQLVNRFVADARAFGTYEVRHLTNYFEANVEFLKGDYAEARKHLGESRSANQRAQDATCRALQDWIDFELLWRYGQKREAVTMARDSVEKIDGNLRDNALVETICRAARLASRAALESREGNLQRDPAELLEFADDACKLAESRTESFPTLRSLVRCEQGRIAWVRGETEEALGRLDQAVMQAEAFGQSRFQAVAYEVRSHVRSEKQPLLALADARRSRALFEACGFSEAVERLEEDIETLLETRPDLEAFGDKFGIRSPEASEIDTPPESETSRNPFRTIELSPDESVVEEVHSTEDTLRPWQGESNVLASLVPPSPDSEGEEGGEQEERRPLPPTFDKGPTVGEEDEQEGPASIQPAPGSADSDSGDDQMPMPPSPRKPDSLDTTDSGDVAASGSSSDTDGGAASDDLPVVEVNEEGESGDLEEEEDTGPPTLPPPASTMGGDETPDLSIGGEDSDSAESADSTAEKEDSGIQETAGLNFGAKDSESEETGGGDSLEKDSKAEESDADASDGEEGTSKDKHAAETAEFDETDDEAEDASEGKAEDGEQRKKRGTRAGMGAVSRAAEGEDEQEDPTEQSSPTTKVKGDVMEAVAASDGVPPALQDDDDEPETQKLDRDEIEDVIEGDGSDEDSPPPVPDGQEEEGERTG